MRTFSGPRLASCVLLMGSAAGLGMGAWAQSSTPVFTSGNVVVLVEGCGVYSGTCTNVPNGSGTGTFNSSAGGYGDNQAAPVTLFQFTPGITANGPTTASFVNSLVLPQTATNASLPLASEYGSSSEGTLQLSGGGQYLTFAEYGINAATFNATPFATYGGSVFALAQSGSLTGQSYTPIARTVALVDPYGNSNSSTALYNVFNTNNPRSVYTADGLSLYISGQGTGAGTDATAGVFYSPLFQTNTAPVAITGQDTSSKTLSQDTRTVQIYNGTLYVSMDTKGGSNNARSFVGTLGKPPATSLYNSSNGPTQLTMANNASPAVAVTSAGKLTLTTSEANGIDNAFIGSTVNLSPSNYFFANPYTMYIADTGNTKQTSGASTLGVGGLQKWVNTATDGSGTWQLVYTVSSGLNLVANTNSTGTTGLYGLTGVVSGANVNLYATNSTLNDLDTTYLYGFQDVLVSTTKPTTSFAVLATAPSDSNFKGVAMAPTLPTGSATLLSKPLGLTITVSGTGCSAGSFVTPVTLVWTPGAACQLTTTSSQTYGTSTYQFSRWQDGVTATTDSVTAPSTSAVYAATFADSTTTKVTPVGASNATVGDPVMLTATVTDAANSSGSPAGNVTFSTTVNGVTYTAGTAPVTSGTATLSYNVAYAGSNNITATFTPSDSSSFVTSADTAGQTISVAQAALAPDGGYSLSMVQGTSGTLTLIIGYPGTVTPTGAITFLVNSSTSGLGSPVCVYKTKHLNCGYPYTANLQPGNYTISFSQAADSNYTASSGANSLTITPAAAPSLRRPAPVATSSKQAATGLSPAR